jgi:pyrroline-5-carboxylate reductase
MATIGFVGGGNMAEALIKGVIAGGVYSPGDVFVSDVRAQRLAFLAEEYGVGVAEDNPKLAGQVDVLVLSVKPQNMADVLDQIKDSVKSGTLVISIAAGIRVDSISSVLGDVAIVRVMPNTPALIGEGASALFANEKARDVLDKAMRIFSVVGRAVVVEDEALIDAVTAVSGSGPAYYFLLMEEMIRAAVNLGLDENVAKELVLQTAKGAALLALEADGRGEGPGELRRKVTSPGGTTEAALKVLGEGAFGALVDSAIKGACIRSKELSSD